MKNINWHLRNILSLISVVAVMFLHGCSSGGGGSAAPSNSISGTAAAGAPIVGYVSVRDSSSNTQPVLQNIAIEANGNYTVDVTGLTPPFAFLASGTVGGRNVSLYSAATSADVGGTINITPFTDLIIRNIAAGAVDTYLSNPANMANLTTAELNAQRDTLTAQLAPALTAMGLSGSIDLLRATFNADSTGLDRFMDVVKVTPDPASSNVTITNILDAANTLIVDTATGAATGTVGTASLAPTGTPLDDILATFNTFTAQFATSLPSPTDPVLTGLFSSTFLDDGETAAPLLTNLTTDPALIGMRFANVVIDTIDAVAGTATVHFMVLSAAGESLATDQPGGAVRWEMKRNASGVWQFNGNQRIAYMGIRTGAYKVTCNPANAACTGPATYSTGLSLDISNRAMIDIGSALVTGPGLPGGGVTLTAQAGQTQLFITTPNTGGSGTHWAMADADIPSVIPNSVYTVQLFNAAATLIATYTAVVPAAPILNADLPTFAFPSASGLVDLAGIGAATLTPSWSIPSGLWGGDITVYVTSLNNDNQYVRAAARTATGTASLVITAPALPDTTWLRGEYWVYATDQNGGMVGTGYQSY